jgi:4-amino-4-deoxy-L-arabinose transferase
MDHPLQPMLRKNPFIEFDPNLWCCNHIWLHKQPLFLWQMALSMKIFGVSELAMRLPSVIMGSLMVPIIWRITILFTQNKMTSLIAAVLMCFSNFHVEMISGIKGMDHNDVALGFYVLASLWSYAEYSQSKKWYWVVLTGIFSGCAILNKWLLGLLVFLGWGINILVRIKKTSKYEIRDFMLALLCCSIIFLPWQFYILNQWPELARFEYAFNRRHITEALEGHSGTVWYYLKTFPDYFGNFIWLFIFIGAFIGYFKKPVRKPLYRAFLINLVFVFSFFSFIVKTKVESHFFFVAPICMIFMSIGLNDLVISPARKWYLQLAVFIMLAWISVKPIRNYDYFTKANPERINKIHNARIFKKINKELPANIPVVMNLGQYEFVDFMFYANRVSAYDWWFNEKDLEKLAKKRIPIAVFKNHDPYILPEYVYRYPYLVIIEEELK